MAQKEKMCILSYIVNKKTFGRIVHTENQKISPSLMELMGPDFLGYLKNREEHRKVLEQLPWEHLFLQTEDGLKLAGYYYENPQRLKKNAVLIHGHGSCGFEGYASVGLKYIRHGYNVLLLDNRACGSSEGKWSTFGLQERKDTLQWVNRLAKADPDQPIVIHGTSLGGATACMLSAMELPVQVKAIVSDCAFANIRKQLEYMLPKIMHVPYQMILPQVLCWFRHETGLSIDETSPLEAVKHAHVPMLFIHGEADQYVLKENGQKLYDACNAPKQLLWIPGAGHAASHYIGKEKYEETLFAFLDRYTKKEASTWKES
jgi:Dipeptidyl aminopeptidases/acylaminoacyl-peptidases